jgi:ATP-dependent Lhr-like helicase
LNGEQFALPEAVEMLRVERGKEPGGHYVTIPACDPLNLAGILTPGPRIAALPGNRILYRDGVPVAALDNDRVRILARVEEKERKEWERLLDVRPASAIQKSEIER